MFSRPFRQAAAVVFLFGTTAALLIPSAPVDTAPSWSDLIAPYRVGQPVVLDYVLSPPRRGQSNDVVYFARRAAAGGRPASRVEIHIVDRGRWSGVLESKSFGVAWEVPPPESTLAATPHESTAVTRALFEAIAVNDTGFDAVDSIPLASEPPLPLVARALQRLNGARGAAIGIAISVAVAMLAQLPYGAAGTAIVLTTIGLALRLPALDLPFAHDQDVQRMLTGNSSPIDIATGVGLRDRHPPLYFYVLHVAQWFGQSEAVGRAPAVIAGALAAPAVLLGAVWIRRRAHPTAALAALAVAISPVLVAHSREVSGIPLYALLLVAAATSLTAAAQKPQLASLLVVSASHALALFTYYLAPFVVAANGVNAWRLRLNRRSKIALAVGVAAGTPALLLAFATLVRDWSAREVARAFPTIAWGQHHPLQMASEMTAIAGDGFGTMLWIAIAIAAILGIRGRDVGTCLASSGVVASFAAVALLSPIARVQSYYFASAIPLAALVVALVQPTGGIGRVAWPLTLIAAVGLGTAPSLAGSSTLYLPDTDAFMPRFAQVVAQRPESTVVTVAHYDKTLLAYYLARMNGRDIAWKNWEESSKRIVPLVKVHSLNDRSEKLHAAELDRMIEQAAVLVIERDAVSLPLIRQRLAGCEVLDEAPTGRLLRCPPQA